MKSVLRNEPVAVLDACALIAFLNNEDGAGVVAEALQEVPLVKMAAVNVLEVAYDAVRQTGQKDAAGEILRNVAALGLNIDSTLSDEMIQRAAVFKTSFRLSLADSIALALAAVHGAPLLTSDRRDFSPIHEAKAARIIFIR